LWKEHAIETDFVRPLKQAAEKFGKAMEEGEELEEHRTRGSVAEMGVLGDVVGRVERAVGMLN
jgi:hypothetical protein